MARIPDYTAEQQLDPGRAPQISIDTSAQEAAGKIGSALIGLGTSVGTLGAHIEKRQEQKALTDAALMNDMADAKTRGTFETLQRDMPPDGSGFHDRFLEQAEKLQAETIAQMPEQARAKYAGKWEIQRELWSQKAAELEAGQRDKFYTSAVNDREGRLLNDVSAAANSPSIVDNIIRDQEEFIDNSPLTPAAKAVLKQKWRQIAPEAELRGRAATDLPGAIEAIRGSGQVGSVADRIIGVESGGTQDPNTAKNPTSSATGAGQFIDSTWRIMVAKYHPELAEGKSKEQVLALRSNGQLSREMTARYAEENQQYLAARGLPTTPGATYLAHFLGPAGAAAVLKAPSDTPVASVLSSGQVNANRSILQGKTASDVVAWSDRKMGGSTATASVDPIDPRYSAIPYDRRQAIERELHTKLSADVSQRVQEAKASFAATGEAPTAPTDREIVAAYGPEKGSQVVRDLQNSQQLGRDRKSVSQMPVQQQDALLSSYTPEPGADVAKASQRQSMLAQAITEDRRELAADPAQYTINHSEAVQDAYRNLSNAMSSTDAGLRRGAAQQFAQTVLVEQERKGVPAAERFFLPKQYLDGLAQSLGEKVGTTPGKPVDPVQSQQIVGTMQAAADMWGPLWPQVYQRLAKSISPVARVIGSGVKEQAAQVLSTLASTSVDDILKMQPDVKAKDLKEQVSKNFEPLARTVPGVGSGIQAYNDFSEQGTKLAAFYVSRGSTVAAASERAFDELVGFKYDFASTYRIPKSAGIGAPDAEYAAHEVLNNLDGSKLEVPPGEGTEAFRRSQAVSAYQRSGVWITAPDESGLVLTYGDRAVLTADGKPVSVTWSALQQQIKDAPLYQMGTSTTVDTPPIVVRPSDTGATP